MDVRKLIPRNKHDHEVINDLQKLSFEQLKPIIPDLLIWLQDMNWPIASSIADILSPYIDRITPEIIEILKTDDGMWKFWILNFAKTTTDPLLLSEIERIAKFPTRNEIEDEVNLIAISILNGEDR
jgi:hypothetical protein